MTTKGSVRTHQMGQETTVQNLMVGRLTMQRMIKTRDRREEQRQPEADPRRPPARRRAEAEEEIRTLGTTLITTCTVVAGLFLLTTRMASAEA